MNGTIQIWGITGLPEIRPGDSLPKLIAQNLPCPLEDNDVLILASKVVSKAEGRVFRRADIQPCAEALRLSALVKRDPAYIELALRESERVVKAAPGVLICRTHAGFVLANAGVDASNAGGDYDYVALPLEPDQSASRLREELCLLTGRRVGVILSDTFGRAWRRGQTDVAIGCSGIGAFVDYTGTTDRDGMPLSHSLLACADELAGAAELVMHKSGGIPAALIRGVDPARTTGNGASIPYAVAEDLFL